MFGSQSLILSVILKSLDEFLVVDQSDIEGKLLSAKGSLKLVNVGLKSIRLPVTKQHYVVVTGKVSKINFQWNLQSKSKKEDGDKQNSTLLIFDGVFLRISCHHVNEDESVLNRLSSFMSLAHLTPSSSPNNIGGQQGFSFGSEIINEFNDLHKSITKFITDSIMESSSLQAFLDSITFKIFNLKVEVEVPEDEDSISSPDNTRQNLKKQRPENSEMNSSSSSSDNTKQLITFVSKSIEMLADETIFEMLINDKSKSGREHPVRVTLKINSAYLELCQETEAGESISSSAYPIVEPFSYVISGRRSSGQRFLEMTRGFQAIGRRHSTAELSKEHGEKNGIVIHLGQPQIDALKTIANKFLMDDDDGDGDDNLPVRKMLRRARDAASSSSPPQRTEYLRSAVPFLIVLLFMSLLYNVVHLELISKIFHIKDTIIIPAAVILTMFAGLIVQVTINMNVMENFGSVSDLDDLYGKPEVPEMYPGSFRFPIEFITLIGPKGLRATLFQASFVGRLDTSMVNFAANQFELDSLYDELNFRPTESGPRISASGIRTAVNNGDVLVNIDETNRFYVPGQFQITEPISCTVLRFDSGALRVKVNEVKAQMLRGMSKSEERLLFLSRKESDVETESTTSFSEQIRGAAEATVNAADSLRQGLQKGVKQGVNVATNTTEKVAKGVQNTTGRVKDRIVKGVTKTTTQVSDSLNDAMKGVKLDGGTHDSGPLNQTGTGGDMHVHFMEEESLPNPIRNEGKMLQIRSVIKKQNRESLQKLRLIALEFESISLQSNRHNLRLYPKTFRGCDAVDFLLDTKIAKSRSDAVRIGRSLQDEFNLFEHIFREAKFRDEYNCIYHFEESTRRRQWEGNMSDDDVATKSLLYEWSETPDIPIPLAIGCKRFVLKFWQDQQVALDTKDSLVFIRPGSAASRVVNMTTFIGQLQNNLVKIANARIRAKIHPDLPNEVHCLQFSVDNLKAAPGLTTEDWFAKFGFTIGDGSKEFTAPSSLKGVIALPHAYISPFSFSLRLKGTLVKSEKETNISIKAFDGDESTTSTDLIYFFGKKVLGRAPGLVSNLRVMGVNVTDSAALTTTASAAGAFVPFGQYIGLATLAAIDSVTGAIDAGKQSRNDPYGDYKFGDITRGIGYAAKTAARKGAARRGKTGFYDDEDEIPDIDAFDFAVGAAEGIGNYAKNNKAKFAGGTVAAATMIGTAVIVGPAVSILIGIGAGASTEWLVRKAEDRFEKKKQEAENEEYPSEDEDGSTHSNAYSY